VGEIISEWWATSNRNGGRDHSGMVGDIERNQQPDLLVEHSPAIEAPVEPGIAEPAREKYRQTLPERIQRLRSTLNSPRRE